ncbi:MAG: protein kinase [Myxococcota bacterium]
MSSVLKTGDHVDERFVLAERVASGGMGFIFRAQDTHTGQTVALKVIADDDDSNIVRFDREAKVLATISHPGVVRYVAHGTTMTGAHYLAMEWLQGEDLDSILSRHGAPGHDDDDPQRRATIRTQAPPPVGRSAPTQDGSAPAVVSDPAPWDSAIGMTLTDVSRSPARPRRSTRLPVGDVLRLGRQLAAALGSLHDQGVVHRDIKPSNVFAVDGRLDRIKLLDFGTARPGRAAHSLTRTGAIVGTPGYMAPEQVNGERTLTPAVDIWAVGSLLFECLVGEPPFTARTVVAVLTKIMLDDPPDIAELRPDLPAALSDLIMRALSRDPSRRPANARALLKILETIEAEPSPLGSVTTFVADPTSALTRAEQRVHCILITQRVRLDEERKATLRRQATEHGAELTHLPDESVLVTASASALPTDQATRVARAGLALHAQLPHLKMAIALGRAAGGQDNLVGHAIERAVASLRLANAGEIRLDPTVGEILEARFVVSRDGDERQLTRERDAESPRTLLGRRSTWVGRKREMLTLDSIFDECVEDSVARAVLVTGVAGAGKSRLRDEFTKSLRQRAEYEQVIGRGDSVSAGSPFVVLGPAIRRYAGIQTGEAIDSSQRKLRARLGEHLRPGETEDVTRFLGELVGVPFPDDGHERLQAARKDPMLMGDAMRAAFVTWLRALCMVRPVVLVLDDLHWGDLPSVRYIDAALRALRELPLMVLAMARPEVSHKFPALWSERALQQIRLDALSRGASRTLVRHMLGQDVEPTVEAFIIDRAGGNAFYLEELIRAVATGGGEGLPDTIVGMLQARFDGLGEEAKRVLRAASVFGEIFWAEGVEVLLGGDQGDAFSTREWLDELCQREVISPRPGGRFPERHEYRFRHALVRDAAHELLTEEDRRLGHQLAGLWLEQEGEHDPSVLAEHFRLGGETARARTCIQQAAAQALEGNDLDAVVRRTEQAVDLGAVGEPLGALRSMQSIAHYWQGDYAGAQHAGVRAIEALPAGSVEWFRALGTTVVASARRGDYDSVERWFATARGQSPGSDAAREQIISLCRGCFQLIFAGRFEQADAILGTVAQLVQRQGGAEALDPLTLAQVEHVRGVRAAHGGDVGRFLVHLEAAVAAFERAGDRRNVSLERPTVGWCFAEVGMFERAEEILTEALALADELGAQQTITYAQVNLGYVLGHRGHTNEGVDMLAEAAATCAAVGNIRLEGWARAHISGIERRRHRFEYAEAEAATAMARLELSPGLHAWAQAERARALVALRRADEALVQAQEAMHGLVELGSMLQGESVPPLAMVEALVATGNEQEARQAAADARTRLLARAERLPRAAWRPTFLERPENTQILELAARLLGG